ncbi:MAG: DNA polymerase III subunit beta [Malacoplasma sp.]|nr:DNA polymerase III subunit beta [Malacoplasma sp.]
MKIIINQKLLIKSLKLCNSIADNFKNTPTYLSTLIEVKDNEINFISTNGSISVKSTIKKNNEINILNTGKVLVKTKTFFAIISKLKNESLILEKVDNSVLKIKGNTFNSNINIMDEQIYPAINFDYQEWKELIINPIVFKKAFSKIRHAISNNKEKVSVMNGIYFNSNTKNKCLEIIGTDSYKLAYYQYKSDFNDYKIIIDVSVIEIFLDLLDFDTNIKVFLSNNNIIFKIDDIIIASKIIEGEYPNIAKIIAIPRENRVLVSKKELIDALDRGNVLSSLEKKSIVKLTFNQKTIEVYFNNIDLGNSKEEIACKSTIEKSTSILLNTNYLLSIIKVFDNDEICIEFQDNVKPLAIKDLKDENFLQLLVPLRG